LRATPVGKHIEPEIAQDSAIKLIDCFQKMYLFSYQVITTKSISKKDNLLLLAFSTEEIVKNKSTIMPPETESYSFSLDLSNHLISTFLQYKTKHKFYTSLTILTPIYPHPYLRIFKIRTYQNDKK